MEGLVLALNDPFDDATMTGCMNLGAAENELCFDLLQERIAKSTCLQITRQDTKYNNFLGVSRFRQALQKFISKQFICTLNENQVGIFNGCGSAVESLFHVLCDENDGVMLFSPVYGGFLMDLERRARVTIVPVDLKSSNGYQISEQMLQDAYDNAKVKVKAFLICNPENPLGIIHSDSQLKMMYQFCKKNNIHYVVDEIYALSTFDGKFNSVLELLPQEEEMMHVLWGFSKDFGVNGFRCGVVVTKNDTVMRALNELSYFTGVPTVMQNLLAELLEDDKFIDNYIKTNQLRLKDSYDYVLERISEFNKSSKKQIKFTKSVAAFFVWIDLNEFGVDERTLFMRFIKEAKVYIAPSKLGFQSTEECWFRMVFTQRRQILEVALDRIFKVLSEN